MASETFVESQTLSSSASDKAYGAFSGTVRRYRLPRSPLATSVTPHRTGPLTKTPDYRAIAPGGNGVWIEPAGHLLDGEVKRCAKIADVSPIRIPGYWFHESDSAIEVAAPPMPREQVILSMHGGGFIRQTAHPSDMKTNFPRALIQHIESVHRALNVEYRLSHNAQCEAVNPFPSALLDVLAGYNYLVNVIGFAPESIILAGNSCGGNLVLALTRYLVEQQKNPQINVPAPPGAIIVASPWPDMGDSHDFPGSSHYTLNDADVIAEVNTPAILFAKQAYFGPHGFAAARTNPHISPASLHPLMKISFKGFPRTMLIAGGTEVLLDQIKTLRSRMVADLGEEGVRYHEARDAVHDYLAFPFYEPERGETLREIAEWLKQMS